MIEVSRRMRSWTSRRPKPEDTLVSVLCLAHGFVLLLAVHAVLAATAGAFETLSLVAFTAAGILHISVYFLPDGFVSNPRHQKLFILLATAITGGWMIPLAFGSDSRLWSIVALILVIPLISQRITTWAAATAVAILIAVAGSALPWLGSGTMAWKLEFLVVELSLMGWVTLALLFDSLELTARLRRKLAYERRQARVVSRLASMLLAATDIHEVFRGVTQALNDCLGADRHLMVRADPLHQAATLVAVSGNWNANETTIDLSDGSPFGAALASGKALYIHTENVGDDRYGVVITASAGLGTPLMIYCETMRTAVDATTISLVEAVADASVRTIKNVQLLGATQEKAQTDPLTNLPNRRSFQTNLHREFERARRHERPLSLLMIDLDFLKTINDRYGHPIGDSVIRTAADQIVFAARGSDYLAARYGGEEFAVILPETDLEGAVAAAQRICRAIAETELPTVGRFTASIGAACFPVNATTELGLIETADAALYEAKRSGRNQVAASGTHTLV